MLEDAGAHLHEFDPAAFPTRKCAQLHQLFVLPELNNNCDGACNSVLEFEVAQLAFSTSQWTAGSPWCHANALVSTTNSCPSVWKVEQTPGSSQVHVQPLSTGK